jgi:death-on-curing protein
MPSDNSPSEPLWLAASVVGAIHREQLAEHGGREGIRDENALEAALARPRHKAAYGEPDLAELAAAYLFGIVTGPFADGNKRTGFLAAYAFLNVGGFDLTASEAEAYEIVMGVAAGEVSEESLAQWFRDNLALLSTG